MILWCNLLPFRTAMLDRSCQGIKASATFVTTYFLATIPSKEIVSICFVLFSRIRRRTACVYVCVPLL